MASEDWTTVHVYSALDVDEKVSAYNSIIPEPTARSAVRRGLLIPLGYLHPGKCEHSEVQSHPPCHGRTTNDGFCRYAHARVITDFKNMADYMKSERWLKASEKAKTKTRTTATTLQGTPEKR